MPSTSYYGFNYPSSTGLVKDGASNIQTLAENVDAKMGMALITRVTGTATAAINIDNCFSSKYDNYLITFSNVTNSALAGLRIRLRVGGVNSTAGYYLAGVYRLFTTGAGGDIANVNNGDTWPIIAATTSPKSGGSMRIMNPADAIHTTAQADWSAYDAYVAMAGIHQVNTAYDGLSLYPASGLLTATVGVYGLRD